MKAAVLGALALLLVSSPAIGSFHETTGTVPDRAYFLLFQGTGVNGLHGPQTPLLEAALGERVRFLVGATEAHTFHLHGHPWLSEGRVIDVFLVEPQRPHAFDVTAGGPDRHPGDWLYHCHVDSHMEAGMWGIFRVHPFATRLALATDGSLEVALDRLGEPVDGATFALDAEGAPLAHHVEALGEGRYRIHAALPARGALALTAEHPSLGASVGRLALGGAPLPQPILEGAHATHAP